MMMILGFLTASGSCTVLPSGGPKDDTVELSFLECGWQLTCFSQAALGKILASAVRFWKGRKHKFQEIKMNTVFLILFQ